ncbi:DNA-3-methyladenine glycosylase [Planomicrobium sp. Y74]|uniref:DNA-3-methyladenine glycosylase family protein n=1 Tax=Planomicrobium sp. Y74 TaxID=2478977 RepID=UPI000EF55268|nr:DNA-3-methyladenine glycosylase [Planomicrobium sp. Y74]RLQ90056.1 DNA-3-methyladenine glycosylase 2 family protein [Planomicrobium sp. Y74]
MIPNTDSSYVRVPVPVEFSFDECVVFLNRSVQENLHRIQNDQIIKLLEHREELILIGITHDEQHLRIEFLNGKPSEEGQRAAADYVWEWFDLKTDLAPFYDMAAGDPILQPIVKRHFGLRVLGFPDLFEAMAWAITGQQINLTFAYTLKKRFVEAYGKSIVYEDEIYWTFPSCDEIAALAVSDLTPMQYSARKAEYIIGIATNMAKGNLVKENFTIGKDAQTVEKELVAIRGIGPWSANYVMMKCLGFTSAFPIADVGLHNALKYHLELEKKPSIAEIERWAENWRGWEAYATFYLWRSLYE